MSFPVCREFVARLAAFTFVVVFMAWSIAAQETRSITFNKNFEGGSLGKIEKLADAQFRCFVEGQHDERGRNRQASWYYFRMDGVRSRDMTLTLTDFVGEYNDKPGSCPMNADTVPVFSYDNEHWQHFPAMDWDNQKKEATLKLRPERERIWVAHIAPYTHSRLLRLLDEIDRTDCARVAQIVGRIKEAGNGHVVEASLVVVHPVVIFFRCRGTASAHGRNEGSNERAGEHGNEESG